MCQALWSVVRLIDWLMDCWSIDWLIDWSIDWLIRMNSHIFLSDGRDHVAYRYEILRQVGKGHSARVYKAYDHKTKTVVALKIFRNDGKCRGLAKYVCRQMELSFLKQRLIISLFFIFYSLKRTGFLFRKEESILRLLNDMEPPEREENSQQSANIVQMYDAFVFRKHHVIVLELLSGNLFDHILVSWRHIFNFLTQFSIWFIHQSVQSLDCHVAWPIDRLIDWLIVWVSDWLIDWLMDWLIDWLIDWADLCDSFFYKDTKYRPHPVDQVRALARSILRALLLLVKARIIHGDLKVFSMCCWTSFFVQVQVKRLIVSFSQPENLALRSPGKTGIKVIDFGTSLLETDTDRHTYFQSRYYRAPEVILGQSAVIFKFRRIILSPLLLSRPQIGHCAIKECICWLSNNWIAWPNDWLIDWLIADVTRLIDVSWLIDWLIDWSDNEFIASVLSAGLPYSFPIDMWSFGCILAEVALGPPLFGGGDEQVVLARIVECLGMPPASMREQCQETTLRALAASAKSKNVFAMHFTEDGSAKYSAESVQLADDRLVGPPGSRPLRGLFGEDQQHDDFVDFLGGCLTWDPVSRMTPMQAAVHPWLRVGSSPTRVLPALRLPTILPSCLCISPV